MMKTTKLMLYKKKYFFTYILKYMHICARACMCLREKKSEKEKRRKVREKGRQWEEEGEREGGREERKRGIMIKEYSEES